MSLTHFLRRGIMYQVMDAEGGSSGLANFIPIYFVVLVFTLGVFLAQLFIAVIAETFAKIRSISKQSAFANKR